MGRQFGAIRRLPSGNFQASYIAPGIGRVTAPITGRPRPRDLEGAVGGQHLPAAVRSPVVVSAHEPQAAHG